MSPDKTDKIDELASDLDDMKTTVEELADQPPANIQPSTIGRLREAVEQAGDATDELEDQKE